MLKQINITKISRNPITNDGFPKQPFPSKHCSSFFVHPPSSKKVETSQQQGWEQILTWLSHGFLPMALPNQKTAWEQKNTVSPHLTPSGPVFCRHSTTSPDRFNGENPNSLPCGLHRGSNFSNNLRPPEIEGVKVPPDVGPNATQKSNWNKRS